MRSVKFFSILGVLFILFFVFLFLPQAVHAQSMGCAVTKVGNPTGPTPVLPAGCEAVGLPNLTCITASGGQYCLMPQSPKHANGTLYYQHNGTKWGSKEMITLLFTVAQKWKTSHPTGYLIINDIAARRCSGGCHLTHWGGTGVDILGTTNGSDCVADNIYDRCRRFVPSPGTYNPQATIELGKLIVSTGTTNGIGGIRQIIYYDTTRGSNVISELKKLGPNIALLSDHKNHFHVDLQRARLQSCETVSGVSC